MAKLNIRPLNDKIVVQRVEAEAKTKGGIVLPDTAKEKPKEGIVMALGAGKLLENGERATSSVLTPVRRSRSTAKNTSS